MGAEQRTDRIGKRAVDAARSEAIAYRLWDTDLKGFGLKVSPRGIKTYFVWYRVGSGRSAARREFTIGRHGEFTPEKARREAELVLSGVRRGEDPQTARAKARQEMTVSQLCDL